MITSLISSQNEKLYNGWKDNATPFPVEHDRPEYGKTPAQRKGMKSVTVFGAEVKRVELRSLVGGTLKPGYHPDEDLKLLNLLS